MKIISVNKNIKDGKAILSAKIESENYPDAREIFFTYPEEFADHLPVSADPFFPAVLIPAMLAAVALFTIAVNVLAFPFRGFFVA